MSTEQFERVAEAALEQVPEQLLRAVTNVAIVIEDEPPPGMGNLLGLYEGVPLTERTDAWNMGSLPDRISIFQGPLQRMCRNEHELREQITITVIHELAHHFGMSDGRLHELGWG